MRTHACRKWHINFGHFERPYRLEWHMGITPYSQPESAASEAKPSCRSTQARGSLDEAHSSRCLAGAGVHVAAGTHMPFVSARLPVLQTSHIGQHLLPFFWIQAVFFKEKWQFGQDSILELV